MGTVDPWHFGSRVGVLGFRVVRGNFIVFLLFSSVHVDVPKTAPLLLLVDEIW